MTPTCSKCGSSTPNPKWVTDAGSPSRPICVPCFNELLSGCRQLKRAGRGELPGAMGRIAGGEQATKKTGWQTAKPTEVDGIRFPSKMEARVFRRLLEEVRATRGARLYRQARMPLWSLAPRENHLAHYLSIDFALWLPGSAEMRFIDAKPKKWKSRDWKRGRAAFEADM